MVFVGKRNFPLYLRKTQKKRGKTYSRALCNIYQFELQCFCWISYLVVVVNLVVQVVAG
jgi:hypothetical protein